MNRRFVLPGPDVGRLMLDRLIAEGVRYGRDFALVRISVPLGSADAVAPLLSACLRDADVIVRWEADELLALLPATEPAGRRTGRAAAARGRGPGARARRRALGRRHRVRPAGARRTAAVSI